MKCSDCYYYKARKQKFLCCDGTCHKNYKKPRPVNSTSYCSEHRAITVQDLNIRKEGESHEG